jgi:hypothetical protein
MAQPPVTRTRGPREDDICGSWQPYTREGPVHSARRHICTRLYHPGSDMHWTTGGLAWWHTGDTRATLVTDTAPVNTQGRANRTPERPPVPRFDIYFDKPAYHPGDTITMTVQLVYDTVDGQPAPTRRTVNGSANVGAPGQELTIDFTGHYAVITGAPTADDWWIDTDGPERWHLVSADPDAAVFIGTAQ